MGPRASDPTPAAPNHADTSFPHAILRSRWLLIVALTALVAFGGRTALAPTQYGLLGAMILSNLVLAMLRKRSVQLTQVLEILTVVDVLVVALVVSWVDPTPQTYIAVFAALILSTALGRVGVIMLLMLLVCAGYAGYLYTEAGPTFWRQVSVVLRVPFLFAVGLHFASIASYLKKEKRAREDILAKAKVNAERADHLSKEQDRLRALSQIGRLALTAGASHPVRTLLEMSHRAQKALGASRCSLVVFPQNERQESWNGRTKDRDTDVRSLAVDPGALGSILLEGKLTELHPGDDKDVLGRVKVFFPDSNPFGSMLVAPVAIEDNLMGALFLLDANHKRKFSEGERDFFWTVALMTGSFIQTRERMEHEVQLRTLITNAPVIMFALSADGTVTLFEGRATSGLRGSPAQRIGASLFDLVDNPEETRKAFDEALSGRIAAGTVMLEGTLFETQFSPLRGIDGEISGVMGVITAILDAPAPPRPRASASEGVDPSGRPDMHRPGSPQQPIRSGQAHPGEARGHPSGRTEFPTPPKDLKPTIPLADED